MNILNMFEKWQIFLFDFDGTLVNSEKLHHSAYLEVAKEYGIDFSPTFPEYTILAHFSDHALKDQVCALCPSLDWPQFYAEKKRVYLRIIEESIPELMPGVERLLQRLSVRDVLTCVVTHSVKEQTLSFCKQIPILQSIDYWITREDYLQPKPASDAYKVAVARVKSDEKQRVVGFEDTVRGLQALFGVEADAFLVSSTLSKEMILELQRTSVKPFTHITTISDFC